jgi:formylglycine-generating enzyme required for sulfatase activity
MKLTNFIFFAFPLLFFSQALIAQNKLDKDFTDAIRRMAGEQGKEVLVNGRAKIFLSDYCAQFKKEMGIFRQILDADCGELINSAVNVPERKQKLMEKLEDENGLSQNVTAEYLDLLGLILKGDTSKALPVQPNPPPPSAAAEWYVSVNGAKKGPLTRADLDAMFKSGAIDQKSYVWKNGMKDWAEAETVQELKNTIAGLPPPLPQKPVTVQRAIPNGFVNIPAGIFVMGSPVSEPGRKSYEIQHQVTVSGFYMGKNPVTQKEYIEVMGTNPSRFKGNGNLPVEFVSWYDAIEYCNKRSQKEGLTPAYTINTNQKDPNNYNYEDRVKWTVTWNKNANGYRLPTEAEWEYACRAGTTTPFSTGNNITSDKANYPGDYSYNNIHEPGIYYVRRKTTEVESFSPNAWGLYDMHGNVWEWCWDWFGDLSSGSQIDPAGPSSGTYRVVRGGSWCTPPVYLRSAFREYAVPSVRGHDIGIRLVLP